MSYNPPPVEAIIDPTKKMPFCMLIRTMNCSMWGL